jgi:hypothetical protein
VISEFCLDVADFAQNPPRLFDKPPRFGQNTLGSGRKVNYYHFFSGAPGVSNFIPARTRAKDG